MPAAAGASRVFISVLSAAEETWIPASAGMTELRLSVDQFSATCEDGTTKTHCEIFHRSVRCGRADGFYRHLSFVDSGQRWRLPRCCRLQPYAGRAGDCP